MHEVDGLTHTVRFPAPSYVGPALGRDLPVRIRGPDTI
jgi:hypothetical protein